MASSAISGGSDDDHDLVCPCCRRHSPPARSICAVCGPWASVCVSGRSLVLGLGKKPLVSPSSLAGHWRGGSAIVVRCDLPVNRLGDEASFICGGGSLPGRLYRSLAGTIALLRSPGLGVCGLLQLIRWFGALGLVIGSTSRISQRQVTSVISPGPLTSTQCFFARARLSP